MHRTLQILATKSFARWMRKNKVSHDDLIVATKFGRRWIYLFGFEKNDRANIDTAELKALQELAKTLLGFNAAETSLAIDAGDLIELNGDE
jgi:hypothetical protein